MVRVLWETLRELAEHRGMSLAQQAIARSPALVEWVYGDRNTRGLLTSHSIDVLRGQDSVGTDRRWMHGNIIWNHLE